MKRSAGALVLAAAAAVTLGACTSSPSATQKAVNNLHITQGTVGARSTATTVCRATPTALGHGFSWMPTAFTLPPGSYPAHEFTAPAASEHAASFVVPLSVRPFVDFIATHWPADGVTFGHAEQDPNDTEFTFVYKGIEGSLSMVHDLCNGASLLVFAYGGSLSGPR